ncbi:hypothetical protein HPB48_015375 [Haemaphysalis longicornis]|uniref:Uncharacterized protein n=1 Tax=Haemaphysalis longicornis TaxID=44386 RepID=A0A9J6H4E0_HAELO|nr:hypothetical protein HPB48_015375 [Haemaphysalis longicornis]
MCREVIIIACAETLFHYFQASARNRHPQDTRTLPPTGPPRAAGRRGFVAASQPSAQQQQHRCARPHPGRRRLREPRTRCPPSSPLPASSLTSLSLNARLPRRAIFRPQSDRSALRHAAAALLSGVAAQQQPGGSAAAAADAPLADDALNRTQTRSPARPIRALPGRDVNGTGAKPRKNWRPGSENPAVRALPTSAPPPQRQRQAAVDSAPPYPPTRCPPFIPAAFVTSAPFHSSVRRDVRPSFIASSCGFFNWQSARGN